ncbi:hypothetical protein Moror_13019 [Moniliophthora roreri MCA 2997]|uniref:Uncharacterized protein n=1 Tax=Moniliophthora roreri (strain MCA 2997) TaxID=1381753 RepID=V2XMZ4_MONRO|nr:hypothetical protein Moror_13019 [Moniliophthora roreri MCA 2997]
MRSSVAGTGLPAPSHSNITLSLTPPTSLVPTTSNCTTALRGILRRLSLQRSLPNVRIRRKLTRNQWDALQIVVAETDSWSSSYSLAGEGRAFQWYADSDHTTLLPLTSGFHLVEDVTSSSPSLVRSNKEHFRAAIHPHRLPYAGSSINGSFSTTARALYFVASLFEQGI